MQKINSKILLILMLGISIILLDTSDGYGQRSKKRKKKKEKDTVEINANNLRLAEQFFTEGEKYFILEEYTKSLVFFQRSLELDPDNAAINYKIAEIYNLNGDLENALIHASEAVRLQGENKYYYLLLAEVYKKQTDYAKAAEIYEQLIEKIPGNEQYLFETATLYIYLNQLDEALRCYDKIEEKYGINEQVTLQKQNILLKQNKLELVIIEGEKLIAAFPGEPKYVANLASKYIANDLYTEATELLEEAIEDFPDNPLLLSQLAEVYMKTGRMEESKEIVKLIFEDPDYNLQGKMQFMAGYFGKELTDSEKEYVIDLGNKIISYHPDEPDAYAIVGDLQQSLNNQEEARNLYLKSLQLNPSNFNAWQNVLDYELRNNEFDSVIVHAEEAITYFPNQALAYFYGGTAYLSQNKYKKAVQMLEQGKKLASSNLQLLAYFNGQLGDAYNGVKEYIKSDKAYEAALDFDPDNDHVLNNYSYFLSLRKEKLDLAEKMSTKLVEKNPEDPTYLDTYAWVLYNLGKYDDAKKYIEKAINFDENNSGTLVEHYGDILFKLGDINGAVEQWEKAKKLNDTTDLLDKKIADRQLYE
jgi:tetratricopeptide (TPR) repeat protein